MDRTAAVKGPIVCVRFDIVELRRCCILRRRQARLQKKKKDVCFAHGVVKTDVKTSKARPRMCKSTQNTRAKSVEKYTKVLPWR